jgi:hypothetical protein
MDCTPQPITWTGSSASTLTVPTPTTLGVPFCQTKLQNFTSTTVTVAPTTWTCSLNGGSATSSCVLTAGQTAVISVDPIVSNNWQIATLSSVGGGDSITSPSSTLNVGGTSSATTLDLAGSAGQIFAGATPALTFTPTLGISGTAGTLSLFPSSGNFKTTLGSAATVNNTVKFFASTPTNLDLFYCAVSGVICTMTDTGYAYNNIPIADLANGTANTLMGFNGSGVPSGVTVGSGLSLSGGTLTTSGGAISGLTTGLIPQAGSATTIVNSSPQLDNGVTTANTLTYVGSGGITSPAFTASGTGAGFVAFAHGADNCVANQPTSSACWEAPATIATAYHGLFASTPSTGIPHYSYSSPTITETISAISLTADVSGLLPGANGGTGVNNTASLTLGTSNQNWSSLGTGIVKNTTTTGALSDAASSDIISLWTGTCSSSTYLNGAGGCSAPSGSGTVTVVGSGTLTSTALVTGGGSQTLQTSSTTATLSSGGALAIPGVGTFSAAGAASTPGVTVTGAPYTAGSATTNFPQLYLNDGTGPTTFSASGTELGINSPTGFTGNLEDFHINGAASVWNVNYQGNLVAAGTGTFGAAGGTPTLTLNGATSGAATVIGPAIAGTATNPFVFSNGISLPNGASNTPTLVFANNATAGFYSNAAAKVCFNESATTDTVCFGSTGTGMTLADNGNLYFSTTNSASGAVGAGLGVVGTGSNEIIAPTTVLLLPQCKITSAVTLTTTTTICSWTLPNAAKTWGYTCSGMYQTNTGSITMLLGTQFADAPTVSTHNAMIWSAASTQTYNSAANTGTTAVTTMTGVAPSASTATPWQASGTFTGSATSGTFVIYGTASTTSDAQINAGSTCQIY